MSIFFDRACAALEEARREGVTLEEITTMIVASGVRGRQPTRLVDCFSDELMRFERTCRGRIERLRHARSH